jgi:dipeptidyl-peptidase-4
VIEDIYAGPQDTSCRRPSGAGRQRELAELGFVVVQIDGMGTNWRHKAFHDVCWRNLKDGGLPGPHRVAARPPPHAAVARPRAASASSAAAPAARTRWRALLHHGDFYRAASPTAAATTTAWTRSGGTRPGWAGRSGPVRRQSNVTHAASCSGKLLLTVGELDRNVDPASTYQVVNALQQAGKNFDFIPVINAGHGAAETPYGKFRRAEFLVRHLLGN